MISELFRSARYGEQKIPQDGAFNNKQNTGGQERSVNYGVEEAIRVDDGQTNKPLDVCATGG